MSVRKLVNVLSGNSVQWHPSFSALLRTTRALIKFCECHDGENKTPPLRDILAALESDDGRKAARIFQTMPFCGMMCFADWLPTARFEGEDPDYVSVVFETLTVKWHTLAKEVLQ